MKDEQQIISRVSEFVKEAIKDYDAGHGWSHIERVVRLSLHILRCEGSGNSFKVHLGALMHDVGDHKFAVHDGPAMIQKVLGELEISSDVIAEVININQNISFSKGKRQGVASPELQIVQDADRLDAMGAIGIARAFNYGGFRGREIYDPNEGISDLPLLAATGSRSGSTVHHFYEKLLLLRDLMNTDTGRKLAGERHDFMVNYLNQFFREWNEGIIS